MALPQQVCFDLLRCGLASASEACTDQPDLLTHKKSKASLSEAWVQTYVALRMNDHLRNRYGTMDDYITFEIKVNWLDSIFGEERCKFKKNSLRGAQRFDVGIWSKGMNVAGLVEVKNEPSLSQYSYTSDLEKLAAALHRWPIRWGIFLYGIGANKVHRADNIRLKVIDEFRDRWKIHSPRPVIKGNSAWLGFLLRDYPLDRGQET